MSFQTTIFCLAISFTACAQQTKSEKHAAKSRHAEPFADMRPAGSRQFSAEEAKAVLVTKAHLEKQRGGKSVDGRYRVTRTSSGYEVFVMFVGAYDEDGKPLYMPGGHCTALLRNDLSVIILPGA